MVIENMKKDYLIDVPVLLIFFARPEQFSKVFEQVRIARPSKLYLYQDGPRSNRPDDIKNIEECREIAENIDWECDVKKLYQDKNVGCDPSGFIAQKWMFEEEEMGIILEDDVVPAQSFFPFAKELLIKYKDDQRINMICGMNNTGITENINQSYFFSMRGSIWGWASWKRVIDKWDSSYSLLDDKKFLQLLENKFENEKIYKNFIKTCYNHRSSGKAHHESINALCMFANNSLNIVPKYNMITNIGIGENGTHASDDIRKLPKGTAQMMQMKRYEIEFPLTHPSYIIQNKDFELKLNRIAGWGHPIVQVYRRLEGLIRNFVYSKKGERLRLLRKYVNKFKVNKDSHLV